MEKLTPEQRQTVARTAAAARWAKPVTQADLQRQTVLQVAEWETDRQAQMGAEEISTRLAGGASVKPGKLTFDKKLKMATASKKVTARPAPEKARDVAARHNRTLAPKSQTPRDVHPARPVPAAAAKKNKPPAKGS